MRFFIFYFIFFCFNWPLPPRTSETKNDWKVSTSVFSEIKRDFTRFLSSHVLKSFQNSKLSSFFVVKMKKKNYFKKKKWKSEFCKIKCAQKNKCGRQLWDTDFFFFFSLMWHLNHHILDAKFIMGYGFTHRIHNEDRVQEACKSIFGEMELNTFFR